MVQVLMALFRATVPMFAPFASTLLMILHALNCFPDHLQVPLVNIYVWHQSRVTSFYLILFVLLEYTFFDLFYFIV
jgi:hypothetical protein